MSGLSRFVVIAIALAVIGAGCASSASSIDSIGTSIDESTTTSSSIPTRSVGEVASTSHSAVTNLSATTQPDRAANGRILPTTPTTPEEAAELFAATAAGLRDDRATNHADLGHQQQVVVRSVSRHPEWAETFLDALPPELAVLAELHLDARAELGRLHTAPPLETIPAWEIIQPEPLGDLLAHYREAQTATGIDWKVLAAINLIETGMGRIDGLSSAGAQGPMQFLPTTWEEVSQGGDIDDPHDAIQGAARYLVRRGGLDDIRAGLWGYNNSDDYVNAVLTYVELLETDERSIRGFYNWEIYVGTEAGTLWLPVGFRAEQPMAAVEYAAENPWAETLPVSP